MTMVTVGGNSIYHEVHGSGEPVLLLHGGFCSLEMMRPQLEALSSTYTVYAPERPGHGRSPDVPGPISYVTSVADTIAYLDEVGLSDVHIVGFSDGAIIGLLIALEHPDRIRSLVSISGNLDPTGFVEGDDNAPDDSDTDQDAPERPDRTRQLYNELSPDGPEHADIIVDKLMKLWTTEPAIASADLAAISIPTMIMAGDHDVIKLEHSALMATSIRGAQLCIVPKAGHGLLDERGDFVTFAVEQFLSEA
ncbi:alpha/beta fold hydrolase [Glaciihabitans sp. dw_435]|uniref:alpha/beta fold hydrolase n=1 Tax=Glaciihabitans sp. dw_435 TaxID=2720081 RepID=UPI001BD25831|nr:alpha/beta hydrolase [Glaciihabitans sp. dw_435]